MDSSCAPGPVAWFAERSCHPADALVVPAGCTVGARADADVGAHRVERAPEPVHRIDAPFAGPSPSERERSAEVRRVVPTEVGWGELAGAEVDLPNPPGRAIGRLESNSTPTIAIDTTPRYTRMLGRWIDVGPVMMEGALCAGPSWESVGLLEFRHPISQEGPEFGRFLLRFEAFLRKIPAAIRPTSASVRGRHSADRNRAFG
jgi:hypothetical protein